MTERRHETVTAGLDPALWYDAHVAAAILRLGRDRRRRLQDRLMRTYREDVIRNGKSCIVQGRLVLDVLSRLDV